MTHVDTCGLWLDPGRRVNMNVSEGQKLWAASSVLPALCAMAPISFRTKPGSFHGWVGE